MKNNWNTLITVTKTNLRLFRFVVLILMLIFSIGVSQQPTFAQNNVVWNAEYFNNPYLLGPATVIQQDMTIAFNWGISVPLQGMLVDNFSVRWDTNLYFEGGSPPVIRLGADALDNGHVHFWVQDNGQGLSSTEQQKIFHPFVRLRKQEVSGNGLGLVIVKKIVERLEGSISLESEVGKGSRFGFTLPVPEFADGNELAVMNGYLR